MEKNCKECGNPFESKRSDKQFCGSRCKHIHWSKNKPLGDAPLFNETVPSMDEPKKVEEVNLSKISPLLKKEREITIPGGINETAQFIIEMQKMDNRELRDTVKDLFSENKTLTKTNADLEKELEKLRNEATRKPTALEGIASTFTADHLMGLLKELPSMARDFKAVISEQAGAPQQLGEGPQNQPSHYAMWLGSRPEDVQKSFDQLMNALMKYKNDVQLKYAIDQMVRGQVMRAVS